MARSKKNKWLLAKAAQEGDGVISSGGWVGKWSGDSEVKQAKSVATSSKAKSQNSRQRMKAPRTPVPVL